MKPYLLSLLMITVSAFAQAQTNWTEGKNYHLIEPAQPTGSDKKIEVVEAFSYMCPHCNSFEPLIGNWAKKQPENVNFVRIPVIFGRKQWEPLARVYYTADVLGAIDKVHQAIFDAVHVKRRRLRSAEDFVQIFVDNGVDKEDFLSTYNSFAVETKLRRAEAMSRRYGVTGVPTIIVEGKYRTDGSSAGSLAALIRLVDFLVTKEAKAKGISLEK